MAILTAGDDGEPVDPMTGQKYAGAPANPSMRPAVGGVEHDSAAAYRRDSAAPKRPADKGFGPPDERMARALESIAVSLVRLAEPRLMTAAPDLDPTLLAEARRKGPGGITYVDSRGRVTPSPDKDD